MTLLTNFQTSVFYFGDPSSDLFDESITSMLFALLVILRSLRTNISYALKWQIDFGSECGLIAGSGLMFSISTSLLYFL